ncbi:PREDICTED: CDKN2AIP N-terminal-like protein-like [Elephantulus edwardii]|uniref:CDKN2AIP N-terminal-like protein-like n=1 Tax=Elephantulus edwardii TaxID=28737 RepID=UPI0003F079D8|nr:PREDICTED: CDKN2AIP N-terminal-like protein-like [Elephantulus edwardii]
MRRRLPTPAVSINILLVLENFLKEALAGVAAEASGEAAAAVEELVSGVRQAADFAEQFRTYSESEKQWKARMEFILRHLPDYRDPPDGSGRLDQLLSLSMVWANHLFLGCSYNKDLLDKVMEMADGIEVEDLPQFTTRSELMKKHQS